MLHTTSNQREFCGKKDNFEEFNIKLKAELNIMNTACRSAHCVVTQEHLRQCTACFVLRSDCVMHCLSWYTSGGRSGAHGEEPASFDVWEHRRWQPRQRRADPLARHLPALRSPTPSRPPRGPPKITSGARRQVRACCSDAPPPHRPWRELPRRWPPKRAQARSAPPRRCRRRRRRPPTCPQSHQRRRW